MKKQSGTIDNTKAKSSEKTLRQLAEVIAQEKVSEQLASETSMSPVEIQGTLHELRVHQIELEMQNEELRHTQTELMEMKERYFNLYELAPVGYLTISDKGIIMRANLTACTMLGADRRELIKKRFSECIAINDQDVYYLKMKLLVETDVPQQYDLRLIKKDGIVFWAHLTFANTTDSDYSIGYSVVITDASERKSFEFSLKESRERYKGLFEYSGVGIGYYSPDGVVISYNRKALENMGGELDDFVGKPFNSIFPKPEADIYMGRFKEALSSSAPIEYEDYLKLGQGTIWFSSTYSKVINDIGEVVGVQIASVDITQRKNAEMTIRLEAERYHALIESTKDWVWVVDSEDHKLTFFNSSVASYFKRNHGVILRQGMIREEMLSEKRRDLWNEFYKKAISEGAFTTEYQTAAEKLNFIVSFAPLIIDEKVVGVSVFAKDITSETRYKEELELSNQALSRRLQQSLNAISKIGEIRDAYTAGHQKNVMELSCAIAREMGLSEETIVNISFGALIHDIGKIYIASDILNKPGKLTNLEYQILQTHVDQSYEIVKEIDFPDTVIEMIHQHHERMDGSGYPQKLVGAQIITEGRILAVADVVEAMASHRPYRPALGIDKALEEIMQFRGEKYDVDVVDACVRLFSEKNFEFTLID